MPKGGCCVRAGDGQENLEYARVRRHGVASWAPVGAGCGAREHTYAVTECISYATPATSSFLHNKLIYMDKMGWSMCQLASADYDFRRVGSRIRSGGRRDEFRHVVDSLFVGCGLEAPLFPAACQLRPGLDARGVGRGPKRQEQEDDGREVPRNRSEPRPRTLRGGAPTSSSFLPTSSSSWEPDAIARRRRRTCGRPESGSCRRRNQRR